MQESEAPDASDELAPAELAGDGDEPTVAVETPDGHTVVMTKRISGRDFMTLLELDAVDVRRPQQTLAVLPKLLAMLERHVVSHDFPDPDILALDPGYLIRDILAPWRAARAADAVPKETGNRSERRSRRGR